MNLTILSKAQGAKATERGYKIVTPHQAKPKLLSLVNGFWSWQPVWLIVYGLWVFLIDQQL